MRSFVRWAVAASFVTCATPALCQQSIGDASLGGRVTDPSGAAVSGAAVSARHHETNVTSTTVADAGGRFRFALLKVGSYDVVVRQAGFREQVRHVTLQAAAAVELPLSLELAGVDATVTVTAGTLVLDTNRSQIAATVSAAEADRLPMNGRNFLELALFVPGVAPTNIPSTQLFPETSAVPGVTLSVASQRNLSNNFIVDGLSANDDAAALSGITYSVDAIEQLQVVTSGAQAELGRALGGYVSVVTRSGTNDLGGTAYHFYRSDRLNAANALSGSTLPMDQAQFGGSLGGPLARGRTFFFGNFEARRLDQTGLATITAANAATINARLAASGYQGPRVDTGVYPNPVDTTNVLGKIDHLMPDQSHVALRYSLYSAVATNARGAGGLSAPSASSGLENLDHALALAHTRVFGTRTVFETRAQVTRSSLQAPPTDPVGPAVNIAGTASFGTLSSSPTARRNTLVQVVGNVSHHAGAHALRVGVDVLHNADRITFPRSARGSYTFASLANFVAGTYNNVGFTQTFGATDVSQRNPNLGLYAQDEWKVLPQLTINAGLRYDLQWLHTIAPDTNNVSPRVGAAWTPAASRRTVIRGSTGLYFDRVPLRALANALLSAGNTTDLTQLRQVNLSLSPGQTGAPTFPAILAAAVPSVTLVNLTTMDQNLQNAHSRQESVEVEHRVGERSTVSLGYQHLRGRQLLMTINQNVPACVAAGANNACRPISAYANNNQYSAAGESTYHGLHVAWLQRPAEWGHYRVSYTLSKSMNNVGEFFFSSPIDPFDLSKDWGRSDDDQRHRLVVNGSIERPAGGTTTWWDRLSRGLTLSGTLQAYSALPLNVTSGVTTLQGTTGRPVVNGTFIARNSGVGSDFLSLSARLARSFRLGARSRLEVMAEGFNLTNRVNVVTRNAVFGSGTYPTNPSAAFGQVTAVGEPRAFQLGARVRF